MQITNGKVSFTRQVRPADYESKACTFEFSFTIEDGEDAATTAERVGALAQEKALQFVGLKPPAHSPHASKPQAGTTTAAPPPAQDTKEAAAKRLNDAEGKKGPGRPPKPPAEPKPDPASVVDENDPLGGAGIPEITDQQMTAAITRRNAALQKTIQGEAPVRIRALIAKFAGPVPKTFRDIPQTQRQNFLNDLEALA